LNHRESATGPHASAAKGLCVCVADGDRVARSQLAAVLREAGYEVIEFRDAAGLFDGIRECSFDLILLRLTLPGLGGIEGLSHVRTRAGSSGILVLKPPDSGEDDASDALDAGADDCLTMPCEPKELLARLRAVLRRLRPAASGQKVLRVGDCEVDMERHTLRQGTRIVHLTRREFDLLVMMMRRAGTPLTHSQLLRAVWGPEYGNELEYLRVYVRLLRKKIESDPNNPSYIRTEAGTGYYFHDPLAP
jgi:two-component system KDP operon response regulator KdpE